jgi:phage terminase small subunit
VQIAFFIAMKDKIKLSLKQKLFCQYYVWMTRGNGTEAVIQAGYEVTKKNGQVDRNLAKSIASENLTKPDICRYVNSLLETEVLNDQVVSVQLAGIINQWADLSAKIRAIDIYYKLKGLYKQPKEDEVVNERLEAALDRLRQITPTAGS